MANTPEIQGPPTLEAEAYAAHTAGIFGAGHHGDVSMSWADVPQFDIQPDPVSLPQPSTISDRVRVQRTGAVVGETDATDSSLPRPWAVALSHRANKITNFFSKKAERLAQAPRRRRLVAAAVAGALVVPSLGVASARIQTAVEARTEQASDNYDDACAEMYPDGPFESTNNSFADELHQRPRVTVDLPILETKDDVMNYLYGDSGVVCDNAPTGAALSFLVDAVYGGGRLGTDSGSAPNIQALQRNYVENPEAAASDATITMSMLRRASGINEDVFSQRMHRVFADKIGRHPKVKFTEASEVTFEPGQAFVITGADLLADTFTIPGADRDQVLVFDTRTGQLYAKNAIGADVDDDRRGVEQDGASNEGDDNGGGGGSGLGRGNGPGHEGDRDGCDGSCGTGSSGGGSNGGGGSGGGGGGGCGGGCGGGGGGNQPPATTPPTTRPPVTTPPTTTPPTTTPPTTTPPTTTPPPTTPPPTHPPSDGPPSGANQ